MALTRRRTADRAVEQFVAAAREASTRLYRTAYLLAGDEPSAQALLDAAVVRAYRRWWWGPSRRRPPGALVRRALARLAAEPRRRDRVAGPAPGLAAGPVPGSAAPAPHSAPHPVAAVAELDTVLVEGLRALPPRLRAVLVLRYWEGLTEPQVAAELGWSPRSVRERAGDGLLQLHRRVLRQAGTGAGVP